jgi:hypothetical protein
MSEFEKIKASKFLNSLRPYWFINVKKKLVSGSNADAIEIYFKAGHFPVVLRKNVTGY